MQGSPEVLAALQFAISAEAHLNAQYRLDWRSVKFMGAKKIAKKLHKFGDDAHDWVKKATDRLLFLEGTPDYTMTRVSEAEGETPLTATFTVELGLEMAIVGPYEEAIQTAMKALDDTTRNLFEHLIKFHQLHIAWLETQLRLIGTMGEPDYVAEKL
jgi:bacterioferritin